MGIKTIILAVLLLCGTAFIFFIVREKGNQKDASAAPSFEIRDAVSGKSVSYEDLKGKVIFVNFWASWCQPCKEEMPSIEALSREMQNNDSFAMITVLYKDTPENALSYMKSAGYTFPVYVDADSRASRNYGVTGVPETYIIDKQGRTARRVIGPADWNSTEEKSLIKSLL